MYTFMYMCFAQTVVFRKVSISNMQTEQQLLEEISRLRSTALLMSCVVPIIIRGNTRCYLPSEARSAASTSTPCGPPRSFKCSRVLHCFS